MENTETKKDLHIILQRYLGMLPKDVGANNWMHMQEMAEEEINDFINDEKRQLAEQNKELLDALKLAVSEAEKRRSVMAEVSKNLDMCEPEKLAWVKKAETAIKNAETINKP